MQLSITVSVYGRYARVSASMEIPELIQREFAPCKSCDDPLVAMATGEVSNEVVQIVMKTRKDAADILAKELSEMIVNEMKKHDTHNGYESDGSTGNGVAHRG